ncbi:NAD(P)/FAD-dependent oxidoreductase [Candidatus Saccharibacteria bacterium]|nr:NAD(P)/FAD-dependent oxidoreductase [Candidatus Saccharibacteria bacterium]
MSKKYNYEFIVIGSGPAGRTAAENLAKVKKSVCLVEAEAFGGAELNTRDLPYKLSLDFAHNYHNFTSSKAVNGEAHHFNLPTFTISRDNQIENIKNLYEKNLKDLGVDIIKGFAHFLDNHTIIVEDKEYTAANFILATGSKLKATGISGLDSINFSTPDTALRTRRLPKFVFVIGGGSTGTEIAEYFATLGSGVIIMELGTHLLPREDDDIAENVTKYFTEDLGITVISNAKVVAVTEDYTSKIVVFTSEGTEKMVRVESIILATGSTPSLDYGLENAGVEYKHSGIIVDKYFNTTAKNIYAIGDCIGGAESSTERAVLEANILTENLLHRGKTTPKYSDVPRKIQTYPEIVTIGFNERDALARDISYKKSLTTLPEYPNSFVKTLTDRSGHIIGTTIVAPNATLALRLRKLLQK